MPDLEQYSYVERLVAWANERPRIFAVVLVGSAARAMRGPLSDLDLLIVGKDAVPRPPLGVQVRQLSPQEVHDQATKGDDFVQWTLRMGQPLLGAERWARLRGSLLGRLPWPDPGVNLARGRDRLGSATKLLEMGDVEAAQEEAIYALSHLARGELLARQVFPASRPELPQQLHLIADARLATMLQRVLEEDLDEGTLRSILEQAARRLEAFEARIQGQSYVD